ncbi:MAG: hypothetical protein WC565_02435 [Parcubacteria group bacterium]
MNFKELNPTIQQWMDSDGFIDSIVSVQEEFNIQSSAPLINTIFDLILKNIPSEEFRNKLLSSLPQDKQNEAVVGRLVNATLTPIRAPLAESGIDISVIAPIDENIAPFNPALTVSSEEVPENITSPGALAEAQASPAVPIEMNPVVPNLGEPATPTPFVIHEEKLPEQVSASNVQGEIPLRPMFYSGSPETQQKTSFASLEFNPEEKAKKVNPENVLNLKDLPL